MIELLRVYDEDGFVVHAESYYHNEMPEDHRHPWERCRCLPAPLWQSRMTELKYEFPGHKITATSIYPSR